jgi:hypothetical protein
MSKQEHRLGVEEVNLVKRRLKVIEPNERAITIAVNEIDDIYGLDRVSFDSASHQLYVAYDASKICLDCIEEVLNEHQIRVDQGWWNQFKEDYYRFVDENVKANAKHVPFSCHKVPPHN